MRRVRIAAALVLLGTLAPGCTSSARTRMSVARPVAAVASAAPRIARVGTSVEGRPIETITLGDGPERVLIIASIHGSEPAGTPLLEALLAHAGAHSGWADGRTVVLMPAANPDGLATGSRWNVRGVDLNRNYPAPNRRDGRRGGAAALSEPEARAIADVVRAVAPDRIVSIHQPLACVDWDGPPAAAEALARHVAAACDLPVRKLGARPGSLGAWAGETLGIPIVTLELPAGVESLGPEGLWVRYGPALRAAIEGP